MLWGSPGLCVLTGPDRRSTGWAHEPPSHDESFRPPKGRQQHSPDGRGATGQWRPHLPLIEDARRNPIEAAIAW